MHLYKRNKTWWVEFVSDGVRHRQSCHTTVKSVAQAWVDSLKVAKKMPTFEEAVDVLRILYKKPRPGAMALEAAWDIYMEISKSIGRDKMSATTLRKRAATFKNLCAWIAKECPMVRTVDGVTPPVAAKYAAHLQSGGKKSKTRKNIIGDLSTVWRILEKASTEVHNPWATLAPQDIDGERGLAFLPDQVDAILKASREVGKEWFGVVTFALHTGLRYGDVAMLTWKEIGEDGVLRLEPRKTKRHGVQVAFPLIAPMREVLDALPKRSDFVFPMHAYAYKRAATSHKQMLEFAEVLKAAGLYGQGFTFHSLRHTAATRLAGAGVGIEMRKRILGHTVDETARRYDHDEHLAEVRAAMEAAARQNGE